MLSLLHERCNEGDGHGAKTKVALWVLSCHYPQGVQLSRDFRGFRAPGMMRPDTLQSHVHSYWFCASCWGVTETWQKVTQSS